MTEEKIHRARGLVIERYRENGGNGVGSDTDSS